MVQDHERDGDGPQSFDVGPESSILRCGPRLQPVVAHAPVHQRIAHPPPFRDPAAGGWSVETKTFFTSV